MCRQYELRLGVAIELDDLGGREMDAERILQGTHQEQVGDGVPLRRIIVRRGTDVDLRRQGQRLPEGRFEFLTLRSCIHVLPIPQWSCRP